MSTQNELAILERAAEAKGRLLRAEADRPGAAVGSVLLTFDVGRILIRSGDAGLIVAHLENPEAAPAGLSVLDEEEPWWRLIGNPLTAAWPGGVEDGIGAQGLASLMVLKLRFREEAENPRVIELESTGSQVRITLQA
ncbi:MAG: hypothetical protein AB8G23_07275 [Myxococcota bacterium]